MPRNPTDEAYFQHLSQFDAWNERLLMAVLAVFGYPPRLLDLGCGTGAMVHMAHKLGVEAVGVDLLTEEVANYPYLLKRDLTHELNLGKTYNMIICLEVAEHIGKRDLATFLENIARHMPEQGMMLFSAASPGQGGENHKMLKPGYWWRSLFHDKFGISYRDDYTNRVKLVWSMIPMPMMWLPANLQVFDR